MSKEYNWHKIPDDSLPDLNSVTEIKIAGKWICLGKIKAGYFALTNKCPHAGGPLGQGTCDAKGHVTCPHHRYQYDIKTGKNTSGEGFYAETYPVEEREDGWYIGFAKKKWGLF